MPAPWRNSLSSALQVVSPVPNISSKQLASASSSTAAFPGHQRSHGSQLESASDRSQNIDFAILTHAHLDHTGWFPVLVRSGYTKTIFANPATIELSTLLLKDSGHLQEEDTANAIRNKWSKHPNPVPLYTSDDVDPVLRLFRSMPRNGGFDISPNFHIESYDAGHILGSSSLELTITENGKNTVVVFSGDVGRYDQPILNDPTPPVTKQIDVLLCESTYGDREHPDGDPR